MSALVEILADLSALDVLGPGDELHDLCFETCHGVRRFDGKRRLILSPKGNLHLKIGKSQQDKTDAQKDTADDTRPWYRLNASKHFIGIYGSLARAEVVRGSLGDVRDNV